LLLCDPSSRNIETMAPYAPSPDDLKDSSSNASSATDYQLSKDAIKLAVESLHVYDAPLTSADKVMVMQGWNKVLAFKSAFSEALWLYWRILVATDTGLDTAKQAVQRVERNEDPLADCMLDRGTETEDLIMGMIDGALRSLCPMLQVVGRESYRPIQEEVQLERTREDSLTLECVTAEDYMRLFARCGIQPEHWVIFCEAFIWTLQTHTPYAKDDDKEDIERGADSAFVRAISQLVAVPAIKAYRNMRELAENHIYKVAIPRLWMNQTADERMDFGERFYRSLLTKHADLLDYFSKTDMDSLAIHFVGSLDMVVSAASELGSSSGDFRRTLQTLGNLHRAVGVPTYAYALVGENLLECLLPMFEREEKESQHSGTPVTVKQLRTAFIFLYNEVMSTVYYPMLKQEKLVKEAADFYRMLQAEFHWTNAELARRMQQVEQEIGATGTYTQTSKELEMGARLAWRNSAKCIGRISWNTLQVRDCRHINTPEQIFQEVEEHLKIATAGTNIQSVMTVFQPQAPDEPFGTRFWSSQYVRYAAYQDEESGDILGDPANLELTEYLLKKKYWTPPETKTGFDVLPLVLKVPGRKKPYVYELPKEHVFEVNIEHPTRPELTALGYRWTTVPAISNFKMNLGGVLYQNMPFNGWFMSTEIVRNLMERYDAGPAICNVLGIDMTTEPMWRQLATSELEKAVLHSFQKGGYTIVDPHAVGQQFCTHVRREREQFGRECPAQWSWIGGLTGPTNPTWHLEMRDFVVKPQYEYCADGLLLHTSVDSRNDWSMHSSHSGVSTSFSEDERRSSARRCNAPRVLIAYGSETGTAEAIARRLKRQLKTLNPVLMTLNEAKGLDVVVRRNITHVICICSTFGMGKAPSNAGKFFETTIMATKSTKFAVLALGSTIYPDFCRTGIQLDKKLSEAGLERAVTLTTADAAGGADDTIEYWLHLVKNRILPPSLENELMAWQNVSSDEPAENVFVWEDGDDTSEGEEEAAEPDPRTTLCTSNIELLSTQAKGSRSIRKITFKAPAGSAYESGDHLSVQPMNSDEMARRFLKCFEKELVGYAKKDSNQDQAKEEVHWWRSFICGDQGSRPSPKADGDTAAVLDRQLRQIFHLDCVEGEERSPSDVFFKTPTCLFDLAKSELDLSLSPKDIVELLKMLQTCLDRMLDRLGEDEGHAWKHPKVAEFIALSSPIIEDSSKDKKKFIDTLVARFPSMVNFLEHFKELFLEDFIAENFDMEEADPALKLPELLVILPRLQPRFYSVSSSHQTNPDEITITVGVLKTTTSRRVPIEGVCSHYLAGLRPRVDSAKIVVVKSSFRLPKDPEAPLIMVGAGTGLSPMIGFLEDRALDRQNGHNVGEVNLFFGCRTEKDFIYEDTIRGYERDGMVKLHLGLSASPDTPKKYVQHSIADMGEAAADLLMKKNTHYYVCGDACMADSCFEACVELLRNHQTMSRVKAVKHLRDMRVEGRWQTDVWGIVSHFDESKKFNEQKVKKAAKRWLKHFKEEDDQL
jgi:nitric oxide synthase oxygenase domain/subunit/sulfite reductase alpha subunit-like flavoprotein/hemoglobin-like flavoprotein